MASKGGDTDKDRRVLLCVDSSPSSKFAFKWFLENVYKEGDYAIICHIPEAPSLPAFSFKEGLSVPSQEWLNSIQKKQSENEQLYRDYEQEAINRRFKYKMIGQHHPKPGKAIVEYAAEEGVSCIVMGTRGLDAVKRVFVGSVSDYVVRHSRVPVIVCPNSEELGVAH